MIGLIGGLLLAGAAFYLVIAKFDSRIWVAGVSAIVVWAVCAFTGVLGCLVMALAIGAMFKADF